MARKGTYYFVPNGWGGQHGTDIKEVKMTKNEYFEMKQKPYTQKDGAYFDSYIKALYYTED